MSQSKTSTKLMVFALAAVGLLVLPLLYRWAHRGRGGSAAVGVGVQP